jgi:hypothetical protein
VSLFSVVVERVVAGATRAAAVARKGIRWVLARRRPPEAAVAVCRCSHTALRARNAHLVEKVGQLSRMLNELTEPAPTQQRSRP